MHSSSALCPSPRALHYFRYAKLILYHTQGGVLQPCTSNARTDLDEIFPERPFSLPVCRPRLEKKLWTENHVLSCMVNTGSKVTTTRQAQPTHFPAWSFASPKHLTDFTAPPVFVLPVCLCFAANVSSGRRGQGEGQGQGEGR